MPTTYAIPNGATQFAATTYTGNGVNNRVITNNASTSGITFQPDLVWIKNRSNGYSHNIFDAVRGIGSTKDLQSDTANSEASNASNSALYGYVSAFNTNGFTATNGTDATNPAIWVNQTSQTFVAWQWKASGTTTNIAVGSISSGVPSIASTVSANPTAGFSIVTYTGVGSSPKTVGHGLGIAPKMVFIKDRGNNFNWRVWHTSLAPTQVLEGLNTTSAASTQSTFNNTIPTADVVSLGNNDSNLSGANYLLYVFAEINGFSKFGSYVGNSSTLNFVYLGFRPRFIMVKAIGLANGTTTSTVWTIWDSSRNPNNKAVLELYANSAVMQATDTDGIDMLSNGFRLNRNSEYANWSGTTYIYMAFAENPFKYANAR